MKNFKLLTLTMVLTTGICFTDSCFSSEQRNMRNNNNLQEKYSKTAELYHKYKLWNVYKDENAYNNFIEDIRNLSEGTNDYEVLQIKLKDIKETLNYATEVGKFPVDIAKKIKDKLNSLLWYFYNKYKSLYFELCSDYKLYSNYDLKDIANDKKVHDNFIKYIENLPESTNNYNTLQTKLKNIIGALGYATEVRKIPVDIAKEIKDKLNSLLNYYDGCKTLYCEIFDEFDLDNNYVIIEKVYEDICLHRKIDDRFMQYIIDLPKDIGNNYSLFNNCMTNIINIAKAIQYAIKFENFPVNTGKKIGMMLYYVVDILPNIASNLDRPTDDIGLIETDDIGSIDKINKSIQKCKYAVQNITNTNINFDKVKIDL